MRVGVLDLGTNSTRLLVAEVDDGRVTEVERDTRVTRLGEGVETTGRLSDAAIARVTDAVAGYRDALDRHGAERTVALATSAMRDAENGALLTDALSERYDVHPVTISGEEEARLTFAGATAGRTADGSVLVIDIGGGSTEYVAGRPGSDPDFHTSTRMGSVRHTERHLHDDPPTPEQLSALADDVHRVLAAELPEPVRAQVERAIAVAGTATTLAAIDLDLDPYDSDGVHGHVLALATCERIHAQLAALPIGERRGVTGLHPDRAPTIVAGIAILGQSLRALGLDEVEVSDADILHGAALAAAQDRFPTG